MKPTVIVITYAYDEARRIAVNCQVAGTVAQDLRCGPPYYGSVVPGVGEHHDADYAKRLLADLDAARDEMHARFVKAIADENAN